LPPSDNAGSIQAVTAKGAHDLGVDRRVSLQALNRIGAGDHLVEIFEKWARPQRMKPSGKEPQA
jgi:predicted regulator of amino acid metabolism with ACT domain